MTAKYKYKTKSEVTEFDKRDYKALKNGNVLESVDLVHSKEIKLGVSNKGEKNILYSSEAIQNLESARVSKDKKKSLDKGIQLYRSWFRYLKLACELEQMKVSLVWERHQPNIKNIKGKNAPDIPQHVKDKAAAERYAERGSVKSQDAGSNPDAIFREKRISQVKVNKRFYKDWDLDQVLTDNFDTWWKTHHHLFEGHYPSMITSKKDFVENPNFVYVRLDKTTKWGDIQAYMRHTVAKEFSREQKPKFKISGTKPRVLVMQNNYNALVLRLKNWSPKEICTHKNIYLRTTDQTGNRNPDPDSKRLTVSVVGGKSLYSKTVTKQYNMGLFHLEQVCNGSFGLSPPIK